MSNSLKIILKSKDEVPYEVDRDILMLSGTLNTLISDLSLDDETMRAEDRVIPLPNVGSETLKKTIEWLTQHKDDPEPPVDDGFREKKTDDIPTWDLQFFKVDQPIVFDLILAANYLNIKGMLENGCKTIANLIKGKSADEIRTTFNIKNDFTPEEEEQIRKENAWCED